MIPKDAKIIAERTVFLAADDGPTREPDAACDECGRRGTFARVTHHTQPATVRRYCRRCWPAAHRRAIEEHWAQIAKRSTEVRRGFDAEPPHGLADVPPGETRTWHWSLILGSAWREFIYNAAPTIPRA